jgi:hypothetical protein
MRLARAHKPRIYIEIKTKKQPFNWVAFLFSGYLLGFLVAENSTKN